MLPQLIPRLQQSWGPPAGRREARLGVAHRITALLQEFLIATLPETFRSTREDGSAELPWASLPFHAPSSSISSSLFEASDALIQQQQQLLLQHPQQIGTLI